MGLYKRKDSPNFWMSFRVGKRRTFESTGTSSKKLAQKIYAKRYTLTEGRFFKDQGETKTLKDMIERYSEEYLSRKEDPDRDKSTFRHLKEFFGEDTPLCEIEETIGLYEQFRRDAGRAPATIVRELGILRRMFNIAIKRWRWVKENPVHFIELPVVRNERCRYLSKAEFEALDKVMAEQKEPEWLYPITRLALNTGLRQGNLLSLEFSWVDFEHRLIIIGGAHMKNMENLGIPLTDEAYEILKARLKVRHKSTDLVFHEDGERVYTVKLQRAFKKVCKGAGIEDFRFHDLRHTFASYLRQKGVDLQVISQLLAHKDTRMTLRYAHLCVDNLRDAVSVLDKRLRYGYAGKEKGATDSVTP